MTDQPSTVPEIAPAAFERELRDHADVVVLDTRDREAFATWHVEAAGVPVVNVPEADIVADPAGTIAALPRADHLRVICNAGNASRRVVAALADRADDIRSVRGGLIGWSRVLQHDEIPLPGPFVVVQFRREARGCLSYLVIAGDEALVVDPAPDVRAYLDATSQRSARIVRVVDTHVHADHLSGARELATRAQAALHHSVPALARGIDYGDEVDTIADGDALQLGDAVVRVVALPGHTSDMTGLMLGTEALIGGDSLFADSVARPDLETGDAGAGHAARQLYRTLRERIGQLPDTTVLLPGHYPGGRLGGPLAPTLGQVRAAVAELHLDEESFVRQVLAHMPPRPANYLEIIAANLGAPPSGAAAARLEIGANNCAVSDRWDRSS